MTNFIKDVCWRQCVHRTSSAIESIECSVVLPWQQRTFALLPTLHFNTFTSHRIVSGMVTIKIWFDVVEHQDQIFCTTFSSQSELQKGNWTSSTPTTSSHQSEAAEESNKTHWLQISVRARSREMSHRNNVSIPRLILAPITCWYVYVYILHN